VGEYEVRFSTRAYRQFGKLDPATRSRLAPSIQASADDPRPVGAKRLVAAGPLMRIRVGAWRVVYTVDDGRVLVLVVTLGHRRDVYRER
jgi:mRNA interferase RelE/StbE